MKDFGERVAEARNAMGWKQDELAKHSGVPKRTIQDIESGVSKNPQRKTRHALQRALRLEGNPEQERDDWPDSVKTILDLLGAQLMTMSDSERILWLHHVLAFKSEKGRQP